MYKSIIYYVLCKYTNSTALLCPSMLRRTFAFASCNSSLSFPRDRFTSSNACLKRYLCIIFILIACSQRAMFKNTRRNEMKMQVIFIEMNSRNRENDESASETMRLAPIFPNPSKCSLPLVCFSNLKYQSRYSCFSVLFHVDYAFL